MKNLININKEINTGYIRSVKLIKGKKGNEFAIDFITFIFSLSLSFLTCTCTLTGGKKPMIIK